MSEIDPEQRNLEESKETPEIILPAPILEESKETPEIILPAPIEVEDAQRQILSEKSEGSIKQNLNLPIPVIEDKIEELNLELSGSQEQATVSVTNSDSENPSSFQEQEQPLTLETIYHEIKSMQGCISKLQISLDLLSEKILQIEQQKFPSDLIKNSTEKVESKRKQAKPKTSNRQKVDQTQSKLKPINFNSVTYLKENGEEKLLEELEQKTNAELTQIIRSEGIKIAKDLKNIERNEMIQEIVLNANRRLKHGSVFLKD